MKPLRVLLAEDHETVRHGLRLLIDGQDDMEVVGEAPDGVLAVDEAASLLPDVVILDLSMPNMNGLSAARALREASPSSVIVALTRHDDEAYVEELFRAGASGYVLKQSPSTELLQAVRAAVSGQQYLDATLTARARLTGRTPATSRAPAISEREAEVLKLTAVGYSNKEIAAKLDISVKTVEVHKANASRKLGLHGRIDVIKYAHLQGWLIEP
jgi:DNA-binding NarL/FixJ family response regulator